jgi:hypothetical protein
MAHIIPEGWQALEATGAQQREIETLALLAAHLPDAYTVYHGVHWTRINQGHALVGEIDFAIVNPAGNLLLIEQKSGYLAETPGGLSKQYNRQEKLVSVQMARSAEALRKRLYSHCQGDKPALDSLLYCPDYHVKQPGSAGIDPARIVDASRREHLVRTIRSLLPEHDPARPHADEVHRFLRNELRLVADVATVAGQARTLYTRLSGGWPNGRAASSANRSACAWSALPAPARPSSRSRCLRTRWPPADARSTSATTARWPTISH